MEYKKIKHPIYYNERYLPNKRCKNPRTHTIEEDIVLKVRAAEELPAACIVYHPEGAIKVGYAFDSFWRQPLEKCGQGFEYQITYPDHGQYDLRAGSKKDIAQGWDMEKSIRVDDNRAAKMNFVRDLEENFIWHGGTYWRRLEEPYFATDFTPYGKWIFASIRLCYAGGMASTSTTQIFPDAYALRDKDRMISRMKEVVSARKNKQEMAVDNVDVLMPEVFKLGIGAENEILKNGASYLPSDITAFFGALRMFQDPKDENVFADYVRKRFGEYAIRVLRAKDEPLYRLTDEVSIEALNLLLTELVDAKDNQIPF